MLSLKIKKRNNSLSIGLTRHTCFVRFSFCLTGMLYNGIIFTGVKNMSKSKTNVKAQKAAKIILIICSVLLITVIIAACIFSVVSKKEDSQIYQKALIVLMPESIKDSETNYTFRVKENPDGITDENNFMSGFIFYYTDETGKEVQLDRYGMYYDENNPNGINVGTSFILKAVLSIKAILKGLYIAIAVIIVIMLLVGIYFWYLSWEKYDSAQKSTAYGASEKSPKRKNN